MAAGLASVSDQANHLRGIEEPTLRSPALQIMRGGITAQIHRLLERFSLQHSRDQAGAKGVPTPGRVQWCIHEFRRYLPA